jgi:osmotically-inducible protein OsmY
MKTDQQLKLDVESELSWDASIIDNAIIVSVENGVVTLGGHVPSFADKFAAEKATKNIAGVCAVANDIEVRPGSANQRSDTEIAEAAVNALKSSVSIPPDRIKVVVSEGWITLDGAVALWYQKSAAESAVRNLWGVRGVTNKITLEPVVKAGDVRGKIHGAFQRHAALDAKKVKIEVFDGDALKR